MDRNIDIDPREPDPRDRESHANEANKPREGRSRNNYQVSSSERITMTEIGRFRTINLEDLAKYRYLGMDSRMRREIDNLASQGLVQTKSVWTGKDHETLKVVTLTKAGKKYLDRAGVEGVLYVGIVKPNEIAHDSAIYRMYQKELERIAKDGGSVRKAMLDYELKRQVYSKLAKENPSSPEYKQRQQQIATEHGLKVVRGHIQLPDLRIEYITRDGNIELRDLELATTHYRGGSLGAKAEAGFQFYASASDSSRLSAIFDDHHITAEILWL